MKTVMEQLMEIQDKLDALKAQEQCGCDDCGCKDQVTLTNRTVVKRTFTEEQVVEIAMELMSRTIASCKEAITNACFDDDNLVSLELNYNNQIEINVDGDAVKEMFNNEIDDFICTDADSVAAEVDDVIEHLDFKS